MMQGRLIETHPGVYRYNNLQLQFYFLEEEAGAFGEIKPWFSAWELDTMHT